MGFVRKVLFTYLVRLLLIPLGLLNGVIVARFLGPESFPGIDLDRALVNLNRAEDLERLESEN